MTDYKEVNKGKEENTSQVISHEIQENVEELITVENNLMIVCPHFKDSGDVDMRRMVNVWRPFYYQVSHKLPCFQMLIKTVTLEDKTQYSRRYGDFNEKVIWDDCNLEIKSSASDVSRKHFLQGCDKGHGVLENVIIEQKGDSTPSLIEENADQWMVMKNLLLMKDCASGEIIVFSRQYYQPKLNELIEAVGKFGNISDGEWACKDSSKIEKTQAFGEEFESDSDIIFFE